MDKRFLMSKRAAYKMYLNSSGISNGRCFHVTCIFNGNKLVSIGHNCYKKSHPMAVRAGYLNSSKEPYIPGIHSELSAIIKAGKVDCSNFDFYNIRIMNDLELGESTACHGCSKLLRRVGFKSLTFVNKNKEIVCIKNLQK